MTTTHRHAFWILLLAGTVSACGGGGGTPTAPTPAVPPVTRIINLSGNLAFGEVQVGSSRAATFTIANGGNATLTVNGLNATGGIVSQSTASWTSGQIAPGASQQVTITFRPTTAGVYSGTLTVDADHTSGSNTLPISGMAIDASFTGARVTK